MFSIMDRSWGNEEIQKSDGSVHASVSETRPELCKARIMGPESSCRRSCYIAIQVIPLVLRGPTAVLIIVTSLFICRGLAFSFEAEGLHGRTMKGKYQQRDIL